MSATCEAHPFDPATDTCKTCGFDFCPDCLVYPRGDRHPPFCVPCALAAAGVRSTAGRAPRVQTQRMGRLAAMRGSIAPRVAAGVALTAAVAGAALTLS